MQKWRLILAIALTGIGLARGPIAANAQGLPGGFVYLRDIDPTIIQDIRYASSNNFVGRPLAGYQAAECVVKREVGHGAEGGPAGTAAPQKLSLKMFDCYRPERAVADMVAWSRDGKETPPRGASIRLSASTICSGSAISPTYSGIRPAPRSISHWSI